MEATAGLKELYFVQREKLKAVGIFNIQEKEAS